MTLKDKPRITVYLTSPPLIQVPIKAILHLKVYHQTHPT
jgi:hypothetical protein